jgi:hypothetical protein
MQTPIPRTLEELRKLSTGDIEMVSRGSRWSRPRH